jgi:hypothetical protein
MEATGDNAAGRDVTTSDQNANAVEIANIQGGQNFIGIQGDVNVYSAPPRSPRIVAPSPGEEHISDEQKVEIQKLREAWITLHNAIKKKPLEPREAWIRINRAAGATSYHLILRENYGKAVTYIHREIAMLRSMSSAPTKDTEWRSKRIAAIKARCKNQLGDQDAYKAYIKKAFKADSLTDLATDELQKTYSYIMARKRV